MTTATNKYAHVSRAVLEHCPHHLLLSGQPGHLEQLVRLLLDWDYLEARVQAGLVFQVVAELEVVWASLAEDHQHYWTIRLLAQALRQDVHFIARHPDALLQCLWNRCCWAGDASENAGHRASLSRGTPRKETSPRKPSYGVLQRLMRRWRRRQASLSPTAVWLRLLGPSPMSSSDAQALTLAGHSKAVYSVAYSPDGSHIISGSPDGTIRMWDVRSGRDVHCLTVPHEHVHAVAWSGDGRTIACGCLSGRLIAWDASSLAIIQSLNAHKGEIGAVAFHPDGTTLASGGWDGAIREWAVRTGTRVHLHRGHKRHVSSLCYSPDGAFLLSGSWDRTVRLWTKRRRPNGTVLWRSRDIICTVAIDRDGHRCVAGTQSGHLWVGTHRSRERSARPRLHSLAGFIRQAGFSSNSSHVIVAVSEIASNAASLVRVDCTTGTLVTLRTSHDGNICAMAIAPNEDTVATGGSDGTVRLARTADGDPAASTGDHQAPIRRMVTDSRRGCILTCTEGIDARVTVWDLSTGHRRADMLAPSTPVRDLAVCTSGSRLRVAAAGGSQISVWQVEGHDVSLCFTGQHPAAVTRITSSNDGHLLAVGCSSGEIVVWNVCDGSVARRIKVPNASTVITVLAFSPKSSHQACGSSSGHVWQWQMKQKRPGRTIWAQRQPIDCIAYSPGGEMIAAAASNAIGVWRADTGRRVFIRQEHRNDVIQLAFSRGGRQLHSTAWDKVTLIWDTTSGRIAKTITGIADVEAVAAGPRRYPYRALTLEQEWVIEEARSGRQVAWFPARPTTIITHQGGHRWVGHMHGSHQIYCIELESLHG